MDTALVVVIVAVIVVALIALASYAYTRQRSSRLKSRFGDEYDSTVSRTGDKRAAERDLASREKRVRELELHELTPTQRSAFAEEWTVIQARFVDHPVEAVGEADDAVKRAMSARGYPITDFETQAADLSVDHADVVRNYRAGHAIATRNATVPATTEELRQAMLHYRELFDELLGTSAAA
jgi:hypothetical protein